MKRFLFFIVFALFVSRVVLADNADYSTLRTFMSAQMYGEAYNELMQRELSGMALDSKLKSLKIDLLERTNQKLQKQAKVSPDDATIFTILADIAFQKGDYDRASMYISTAISNNGKAMTNYVFAKILFRKGNISQAFDQMSKVLEAMPESPVVFNDFQFLYNCKQYGVATAKKITKDCNFLVRSTPIAYDGDELAVPVSPFDNDPTETADAPDFSDYNTASKNQKEESYDTFNDNEDNSDNDLDDLINIDDNSEKDNFNKDNTNKEPVKEIAKFSEENTEKKQEEKAKPEIKKQPTPSEDSFDDDFDFDIDEPEPKSKQKEIKIVSNEKNKDESEEDPELEARSKAESLLASARAKYKNGDYELASSNIEQLKKEFPGIYDKKEVEDLNRKIDFEINLRKRYKEAKIDYDNGDFEKSVRVFEEAYNRAPKEFPEAPFYIGRCHTLTNPPDYEKALYYFNIILGDKDLNSELKRDILWTKLEIYYDQLEDYQEADEIFDYFLKDEYEFAKNQEGFYKYYYGIKIHKYKILIISIIAIIGILVIVVFVLQFMPDLALIGGDPLKKAKKALDEGNLEKAIKYAEKALQKKQPIQLDRQLREILVEAYFSLENFEQSQFHAKTILKDFPENNIAWGYLAKASLAIKDTSHEAVKMYENIYKNDPSRKEILPILAHYYSDNNDSSEWAISIMQDYHHDFPEDKAIIIALAEGYVKNRTMNEEVVPILNDAIKLKDKIEYRELLARTFSKCGLFEEAARECVTVLKRNINNIGIHVVYTSSMKKLKQTAKAIAQYKEFIETNPGNNQLIEILNGLKQEEGDTTTVVDEVPSVIDDLGMPGMDELNDSYNNQQSSVPVPDFLATNNNQANVPSPPKAEENSGFQALPDDIQTLNPFSDNDALFDGFDTEELPEELGGTSRAPLETSKSLDSLIDDFNMSNNAFINEPSSDNNMSSFSPNIGGNTLEIGKKINEARDLAVLNKWNEIIELLSPEFASERNKEVGMLLIEAWLRTGKPEMALEIIQALDFDPEMMSEEIKDVMYRTAMALENNKKYSEALKLYDIICNADINYRDAFDRSDRLYVKMKG